MRIWRTMLTCAMVAALTVPIVHAQATQGRRAPQDGRGERVQMPRPGTVSMIGVRLSDVTADNLKTLKVTKIEGAVVESVNQNSPAATAGLREKDVIVFFDGERVRSASHLTRLVGETPPGREVMLSVMRDGRKSDLRIKPESSSWFEPQAAGMMEGQLREHMEQAARAAREMSRGIPEIMGGIREGAPSRGRLGATVQELTPELAEYFGVKSGVLVASVAQDSAAAKAGLKAGDVITDVDGHSVASPADLIRALPTGDGSQDVNLKIVRDKDERALKVTVQSARPTTRRAGRTV